MDKFLLLSIVVEIVVYVILKGWIKRYGCFGEIYID